MPEETIHDAPAGEYAVLAAQVTGAHGVGGTVRLKLIGASADTTARSLQAAKTVRAVRPTDGHTRTLTLRSLRLQPGPKGAWLGRFFELTDRPEAQEMYGYDLFIQEASRAALPEGEYYVDQLLGLPVVTDRGRDLGALKDVMNTPANDVYETDKGALIPAVSEYLLQIDLAAGKIIVKDVPGLLGDS